MRSNQWSDAVWRGFETESFVSDFEKETAKMPTIRKKVCKMKMINMQIYNKPNNE